MARYWDGSQWTDDRRQLVSKEEISGWLLFFGYASAIFLPIVGLIIGIALLVKKATGHGVAVLAISIAMFALGFAITTGEDGDAGRSGGRSVEERLQEITSGRDGSGVTCSRRFVQCGADPLRRRSISNRRSSVPVVASEPHECPAE